MYNLVYVGTHEAQSDFTYRNVARPLIRFRFFCLGNSIPNRTDGR